MPDYGYDFPPKDLYLQLPPSIYDKLKEFADYFDTSITNIIILMVQGAKLPSKEEKNE